MISIHFDTLINVMNKIKAGIESAKQYIFSLLSKYGIKHTDTRWSHSKDKIQYLSDIKSGKTNGKFKYTITSPEGYVFETDNMRAFCRKFKLHQPAMVSVGNGKLNHYKGFKVTKVKI